VTAQLQPRAELPVVRQQRLAARAVDDQRRGRQMALEQRTQVRVGRMRVDEGEHALAQRALRRVARRVGGERRARAAARSAVGCRRGSPALQSGRFPDEACGAGRDIGGAQATHDARDPPAARRASSGSG
jgi:hypothetical protein